MLSFLTRLCRGGRRPARRRPQPRRSHLQVEHLEDRLVPSTYTWLGTNSGSWNDLGNWQTTASVTPNSTSDEVFFDGSKTVAHALDLGATNDDGAKTVGRIGTVNNWGSGNNQTVTLGLNSSLTVDGVTKGRSAWSSGNLAIYGSATTLAFLSSGIDLFGGTISADGQGGTDSCGRIRVGGGANMVCGENFTSLHVIVWVGKDADGNDSTGSMTVGGTGQNMYIGKNVDVYLINISANGTLNMDQTANCDTAGSLTGSGPNARNVVNSGMVERGAGTTDDVTIGCGGLSNTGGTLWLPAGTKMTIIDDNFNNTTPFYQSSGKVQLDPSSHLTVSGTASFDGGDLGTTQSATGNATATFEVTSGSLVFDSSGNIILGTDDAVTRYSTLVVDGNFTMSNGTLKVTINGATSESKDVLKVQNGTATFSPATGHTITLAIYVQTQVPNAANTYTIIDTSSGNVATTMFNSTTVSGQSCTFDAQLADSGHDFQIKKH